MNFHFQLDPVSLHHGLVRPLDLPAACCLPVCGSCSDSNPGALVQAHCCLEASKEGLNGRLKDKRTKLRVFRK